MEAMEISSAPSMADEFHFYRQTLDEHYDRRERIIKVSRDITALSKKVIFALHRITTGPISKAMYEADEKLKEVRDLFVKISTDVQGDNYWRYERQISPGIQEFIESLTFYHFILTGQILSIEKVQEFLRDSDVDSPTDLVLVTEENYLDGIADLTGELMRLAISSIGGSLFQADKPTSLTGSIYDTLKIPTIAHIHETVMDLQSEMIVFVQHSRQLEKKLEVLDSSVRKIEEAAYTIKIREMEYSIFNPKK